MTSLYPLRFQPLFRRYLWGGRRLESVLGKTIPAGDDVAESWEVVEHGEDQSVVQFGPLAGQSLHELLASHGEELLGRHWPQQSFPLLFKFLDCNRNLSVQVHPNDEQAAKLNPPDLGKTEAWVILHADPGAKLFAGLNSGVNRAALGDAIAAGQTERCLHQFEPRVGDCVFIPAGVVHALGAGLVVAEIQQSSDTTYRLFDWNRLDANGKPRALHIEQALDVIDYNYGPVQPQTPERSDLACAVRLVECDKFVLKRWSFASPVRIGGDEQCHILAVTNGALSIDGDPANKPLVMGEAALIPAALAKTSLTPHGEATLLVAQLP